MAADEDPQDVVTVPLLPFTGAHDAVRFAGALAKDRGYAVRLVATHPQIRPRRPDALVRHAVLRTRAVIDLEAAADLVHEIAGPYVSLELVLVRGSMAACLEAEADGSRLIAIQDTDDRRRRGAQPFERMLQRVPCPVVRVCVDTSHRSDGSTPRLRVSS
ncbi:MAG: hypothetical protein JWP56_2380 [Aeromicrobium sp.]|jgi:hypothetical protein|nr:hypothetical protein [Aeromicrobium sp.]